MTKKMIAALALVALGLAGVSLALASGILNVVLPVERAEMLDGVILTNCFLIGFFGGVTCIGFGWRWYDRLRVVQLEDEGFRKRKKQYA